MRMNARSKIPAGPANRYCGSARELNLYPGSSVEAINVGDPRMPNAALWRRDDATSAPESLSTAANVLRGLWFRGLAKAALLALCSSVAHAQGTLYEWRVKFVDPIVWHSTPAMAATAYADWYCALPASQGQYINCTPDYLIVASPSWPNYALSLRLTRVSDGGYAYTQEASTTERTDPDGPPPPPEETKQLACSDKCQEKGDGVTGNPINFGTGNKFQRELDYTGAGPFPLSFQRYYNAKSYNTTSIGPKWRHSYERSVEVYQESATSQIARVHRPDGRILTYNLVSGSWQADSDIVGNLTWTTNGVGSPLSWLFVDDENTSESYDASGRLVSITDRSNRQQLLGYNGQNQLISVADSFGRQLLFGYDGQGRLSSVTDPAGGSYQYGYDTAGNLASVTYPGASNRLYIYNEPANTGGANLPNALTGLQDEAAIRYATWQYDSSGRATSSSHAGGADQVSVAYNGDGTATVTDARGNARTHTFEMLNGVKKITSATGIGCLSCGEYASYSYDTSGNVSARTDFKGSKTCYAYDLARNLETVRVEGFAPGLTCPADLATYTPTVGTAQRKITTMWHSSYRLPTQIDEPNRRTTFTYDANANVLTRTATDLTVTPNVSRTWTYTYNSFGQVLTADGPRTDVSDVTTYAYYNCSTGYQCGQVQTITNALGHVTTYNTYNVHGQPLTVTDPNGVITTLTYDTRQRLTSREAGGETTSIEYWPTGLLKQVTLPDLSFILYTYDSAHRLTQVSDSENNRIVYTLDAMGNRTQEETFDPSNALVQLHHRAFNTLNQLWQEIGSANTAAVTTTLGYDPNGNQTSASAPLSRNTSNLFDELNRLKQITDPASGTTLFGYDANDNLTSVTDPRGNVTSYVYTGFGDLKQQTSPDTGVTENVYDSGGNLFTSTDARSKTGTYSYDALNRVTQVSYPDQTITYSYDTGTNNKGRLMQVSDALGSTSWTYSTLGRVASRTQVMSGVSKTVGYGYSAAGQLTTLTTPSGQTISYGYANNRITSLTVNSTTLLSNVLYDPFGPVRQWTWGNGTLAVRSFDQDGNLDQIDSAGLRTYAQDDAFRITGITDAVNPNLTWSYGYDLLDRLTSASRTGQSQTWTYDTNGNRLTQGGTTSSTFTISSTSNRLSSVSGAISRTYGYDAAGNSTSYGGFTFTYNDAGRMTGVSGSATASYSHNALGQRVKKIAGGVTTYFVYDESGHLIGEYNGSGALVQETVWLEDIPVATLRPNGGSVAIYYVHADHLNTPRKVSRPSDNALRWRWDSDPFGRGLPNQNPQSLGTFKYNLRFPGQYFDTETGLSYNYFRDYDPVIGRYVQSDPLGLRGGINTYLYAEATPVSLADPSGLVPGGGPGYFRPVRCFGEWREKCRQQCAHRGGISSCYVTKGAIGMPPKIYVVPSSLSCVCNNDDFCKKDAGACLLGGAAIVLGICLAPEITLPILIRTAPAAAAGAAAN